MPMGKEAELFPGMELQINDALRLREKRVWLAVYGN